MTNGLHDIQPLVMVVDDDPSVRRSLYLLLTSAGYSVATLRRAKKRLGILSKKDGLKGPWFWSLPDAQYEDAHEDAQPFHVSTFGKFEHLRAGRGNGRGN